ncbi:SURF1 family protein [Photobacterium sp. TY1-4]|uniref:SURF1 family protein n=1 Tax=Photobacterium sp. TY1-4 TaxID=2899122 RepID=UPI0021BFA180|nr:SURF1 family protein [Photobacterium sp. TY1-4]UXI02784.1 SURF1 family protein [Photobacterium sp. TY1-4]
MRRIGFIFFTVVVLATLVKLGMWQMSRAQEKESLSAALKYRGEQTYFSLASLPTDPRWYHLTLRGHFDHSKAVLLDNQLYQGQVGYHLLYPFSAEDGWVLVNLGWIAAPAYRDQIPVLPEHHGEMRITGVIAPASSLPELAATLPEQLGAGGPLRVQNIDPAELGEIMGVALQPWVLQIDTDSPVALQQTWTPVVMGPQKHYGYAAQWFLMALAIAVAAAWWLKRSKG